jgi:hypothetical protein
VTGADGQVWNLNLLDNQLLIEHHEGASALKGQTPTN